MSAQPSDAAKALREAFGQDLRQLRLRSRKGSLRDVAKKLGYSHTWLFNVEKGIAPLNSWETIEDILTMYGADLREWRRRWDELQTSLLEIPPPAVNAKRSWHTPSSIDLDRADTTPVPSWRVASSAPLAALLDELAVEVAHQWRGEEISNQLSVRWRSAWDVTDHREAILLRGPIELLETKGKLSEVAGFFLRLPSRRLVVLGGSGIGKTAFAVHLLLGLLRRRRPGEPVPVLLSMSSWDPSVQSLAEWLAEQLAVMYPGLGLRLPDGRTRAARLVADGLLVPILDGFDEMSEELRPRALKRLNGGMQAGDAFVLTSRRPEYERAVHDRDGRVLRAAAVGDLQLPPAKEVHEYLRLATAQHRCGVWDPVFRQLTEQPDGPLATALSTPLMAWLAKVVYAEGTADPGELLGFGDRRSIEAHLLNQLVPTVYDPDWAADSGPTPMAEARPMQRTPRVSDAERWLAFIAGHLRQTGTSELAWWRLEQAVPRSVMSCVGGVVFGLIIGITIAVPSALAYGVATAFIWGVSGAVLASLAGGGMLFFLAASRVWLPAVPRFRQRGSRPPSSSGSVRTTLRRHLAEGLGMGALGGVGVGLLVILVVTVTDDVASALAAGTTAAVAVALAVVVARTLDFWLGAPLDVMTSTSPVAVLRGDRTAALAQGVVGGLMFGLVFGLSRDVAAGISAGVGAFLGRCFIGGLDQGLSRVCLTAWSRFVMARLCLAANGKLPWRTMAFLQDARYRGVLRQLGAVYKFRHDELMNGLRQRPAGSGETN